MTSQTEQAGALARRIEEQLNQVLVGQPAITRQVWDKVCARNPWFHCLACGWQSDFTIIARPELGP